MEIITMLLNGLYVSLTPANILACAAGVLLGTLVGVLPGIGPIGTIALLLPFSVGIDVTAAIIMFAGIYYGAQYGGSTTSILLNVPGEASSVVTCLDGYAMAKKGRGGAALSVAAIGSFFAGTVALVGLTLFAPLLSNYALTFGPAEYFSIAFLGLIILFNLTDAPLMKSALMATLGIILGTVGLDSLTGVSRFSFGVDQLQRGVEFAILAMGVFGLSEVFESMIDPGKKFKLHSVKFRELYPSKDEWGRAKPAIFRGSILGFLIGLLPGPAATLSTFVSYTVEKRRSKTPAEFGQGAIEGVAGPESANNAAAQASMIPLLSLGIPFAPGAAILLSGFMIHGILPGPTLISERPDMFWGLVASMYLGNVFLLIINLPLVGMFASILRTPLHILMPLVIVIAMTGAFALNNSLFDLCLLLAFGVLGFLMKNTGYEPAPLAVGLILGPILERGLVQGLIIGNGDLTCFLTRPISGTILAISLLLLAFNIIRWFVRFRKNNESTMSAS